MVMVTSMKNYLEFFLWCWWAMSLKKLLVPNVYVFTNLPNFPSIYYCRPVLAVISNCYNAICRLHFFKRFFSAILDFKLIEVLLYTFLYRFMNRGGVKRRSWSRITESRSSSVSNMSQGLQTTCGPVKLSVGILRNRKRPLGRLETTMELMKLSG